MYKLRNQRLWYQIDLPTDSLTLGPGLDKWTIGNDEVEVGEWLVEGIAGIGLGVGLIDTMNVGEGIVVAEVDVVAEVVEAVAAMLIQMWLKQSINSSQEMLSKELINPCGGISISKAICKVHFLPLVWRAGLQKVIYLIAQSPFAVLKGKYHLQIFHPRNFLFH
jgi:hypothetical protein